MLVLDVNEAIVTNESLAFEKKSLSEADKKVKKFLLYGLQRSGTNYFSSSMTENFENVKFLNDQSINASPLDKHFRLYDDKEYIPNSERVNSEHFESFKDFDKRLTMLTGAAKGELVFMVMIKSPLHWQLSINKWAKKCNWPSYTGRIVNKKYMLDYKAFVLKWKQFAIESPKRVKLIKYESLIKDFNGRLNQIRKELKLKAKKSEYINPNNVNQSVEFTNEQARYVLKKEYLSEFSKKNIERIRKLLGPHLYKELQK
jgi:hypothetical protein